MDKTQRYQDNVRRSLREMWMHIDKQMLTLPEDEHLHWDELTEQHQQTINNIKAIEAEWITDDEIRAEITVLREDNESSSSS